MPTAPATENPADLIGKTATYHGSVTMAHGPVTVLAVCDCSHCWDRADVAASMGEPTPEPRFELVMPSGRMLLHARPASFTVKAA